MFSPTRALSLSHSHSSSLFFSFSFFSEFFSFFYGFALMASSSKYSEGTSCSGLSSSSSSSTCSSSSSSFMAADQMVKVEIEAAEALADLAVLAVRESGGEPSEAKWESKWKGKRARKEVKTESPICGFVDSLPSRVDLDLRIQVVDYLFFFSSRF